MNVGRKQLRAVHRAAVQIAEAWAALISTRKRRTVSCVTLEPTVFGLPLVVAGTGGKRQLVVQDGQHEYRFDEVR